MPENDGFKYVKLPNGKMGKFPDSMSWDVIAENVNKQFPSEASQPSNEIDQNTQQSSLGQKISNKIGLPTGNQIADLYHMMTQKGMPLEQVGKNMGNTAMLLGPEVSIGKAGIPIVKGVMGAAKHTLGNMAKVGTSSYLGTHLMPGSDEDTAIGAGAGGAGFAGVATLLAMATASMNPAVRLLASSGLGGLTGYGLGKIFNHENYGGSVGALIGALLGSRGHNAAEMAAKHVAEAMTPESHQLGKENQIASESIGVPMTLYEKTKNPTLAAMQNATMNNKEGAKALYPWLLNREKSEGNFYDNLLNSISPEYKNTSAHDLPFSVKDTMENSAYKLANQTAEERGTRVDINPVLKKIKSMETGVAPESKVAESVGKSREQLNISPATQRANNKIMAQYEQRENDLLTENYKIRKDIAESSRKGSLGTYDQSPDQFNKLKDLQARLHWNEMALSQIKTSRSKFAEEQGVRPYENTVPGLNSAKKGIAAIIQGQGSSAIGNTASGALSKINSELVNQIKKVSPEYGYATSISNYRQSRQAIEDAMAKSEITGKNFYNNVLANKQEYEALHERLGNPNAPGKETYSQKALTAARKVFPNLFNHLSDKAGQQLAEMHPEISFDLKGLTHSLLNTAYMNRYYKAVAELLTNPKWEEELDKVAKMKSGENRGVSIGRLISKVATTGGVDAYQSQQGSENHGARP